VIGGGNTAVEEALYLTNHSDDVTLIHAGQPAAEKILRIACSRTSRSGVIWNSEVDEFLSGGEPEALTGPAAQETGFTGELSDAAPSTAPSGRDGPSRRPELFAGQLELD
jgi:thioredoxin reductase (NADPH)